MLFRRRLVTDSTVNNGIGDSSPIESSLPTLFTISLSFDFRVVQVRSIIDDIERRVYTRNKITKRKTYTGSNEYRAIQYMYTHIYVNY